MHWGQFWWPNIETWRGQCKCVRNNNLTLQSPNCSHGSGLQGNEQDCTWTLVHGKMIFKMDKLIWRSLPSTVIEISSVLGAEFRVPEVLVSDNGPCFISEEFEIFLAREAHHSNPLPMDLLSGQWNMGWRRKQVSMKTTLAKVLMPTEQHHRALLA